MDRLDRLVWLRDRLVAEIEHGPRGEKAVSQTAALARQLRDTLREIAELEKAAPKGSIVDELKGRRQARTSRSGKTESKAESGGAGG